MTTYVHLNAKTVTEVVKRVNDSELTISVSFSMRSYQEVPTSNTSPCEMHPGNAGLCDTLLKYGLGPVVDVDPRSCG
jgi:hypothetical protein